MQWITAILAFSVTMLVFAIITSTLVEMIHRIWGLRAGGMRLMLESVYAKVISPHLADPKPDAAAFAGIIMENRATSGAGDGQPKGRLRRLVDWALGRDIITDIPVEVFTQKLADSRIVKAADKLTEDALADIAQKYVAFGREASAYFESRARLFSVLVAIGVAWLFFIHPYKLAITYVKNPEIAQAVANQAERIRAEYDALDKRLTQAASQENAGATSEEFKKAVDALKAELEKAGARSRELAAAGVPLGWPGATDNVGPCFAASAGNAMPAAEAAPVFAEACTIRFAGTVRRIPTLLSAFWLTIGGLLVGLGAPFWARAVSELMAARGVSQRIADIVSRPETGGAPEPGKRGLPSARRSPVSNRTFELSRTTEAKK